MTRFARAKGSKASNERLPNEATPWNVMKEQLETSGHEKKANESKKIKTARELIKEKDETAELKWAEFDNQPKTEPQNKKKVKKNNVKKLDKVVEKKDDEVIAKSTSFDKLTKRQKRNAKKRKRLPEEHTNDTLVEKFSEEKKPRLSENRTEENNRQRPFFNSLKKPGKNHHKRVAKNRDDKEHHRRKPEDNMVVKMVINGLEIEVVKYDGFPVLKDDAKRLTQLRKEMTQRGIPKSEIDAAMKLERRKAEKALARIRKKVCFHCRKTGHNLSDCPELGREEAGTGICFKCGSTEHTHFECKVKKSDEYGFAKCFICREQGHIAKQCPDNPKGLYPDGGSCKLCGDVTHLKKDCPTTIKEKEETVMTLNTMGDDLEALDEDLKVSKKLDSPKKMKIVKF